MNVLAIMDVVITVFSLVVIESVLLLCDAPYLLFSTPTEGALLPEMMVQLTQMLTLIKVEK